MEGGQRPPLVERAAHEYPTYYTAAATHCPSESQPMQNNTHLIPPFHASHQTNAYHNDRNSMYTVQPSSSYGYYIPTHSKSVSAHHTMNQQNSMSPHHQLTASNSAYQTIPQPSNVSAHSPAASESPHNPMDSSRYWTPRNNRHTSSNSYYPQHPPSMLPYSSSQYFSNADNAQTIYGHAVDPSMYSYHGPHSTALTSEVHSSSTFHQMGYRNPNESNFRSLSMPPSSASNTYSKNMYFPTVARPSSHMSNFPYMRLPHHGAQQVNPPQSIMHHGYIRYQPMDERLFSPVNPNHMSSSNLNPHVPMTTGQSMPHLTSHPRMQPYLTYRNNTTPTPLNNIHPRPMLPPPSASPRPTTSKTQHPPPNTATGFPTIGNEVPTQHYISELNAPQQPSRPPEKPTSSTLQPQTLNSLHTTDASPHPSKPPPLSPNQVTGGLYPSLCKLLYELSTRHFTAQDKRVRTLSLILEWLSTQPEERENPYVFYKNHQFELLINQICAFIHLVAHQQPLTDELLSGCRLKRVWNFEYDESYVNNFLENEMKHSTAHKSLVGRSSTGFTIPTLESWYQFAEEEGVRRRQNELDKINKELEALELDEQHEEEKEGDEGGSDGGRVKAPQIGGEVDMSVELVENKEEMGIERVLGDRGCVVSNVIGEKMNVEMERLIGEAAADVIVNPNDKKALRSMLLFRQKCLAFHHFQSMVRQQIWMSRHFEEEEPAVPSLQHVGLKIAKKTKALKLSREEGERMVEDRQRKLQNRHNFIGELVEHSKKYLTVQRENLRTTKRVSAAVIRHFASIQKKEELTEQLQQKSRLGALKAHDEEGYLKLLQETKNERLLLLLRKTEESMMRIGNLVKEQRNREGIDEEDDMLGSEETSSDIRESLMRSKERYYRLTHNVSEKITKLPECLKGGQLRSYQMEGLNWLVSLYNNGLNGILADAMGLGKTVQTVALIAYLYEVKGIRGPHLIVAPLSTLHGNWENEFNRWLPGVVKLVYEGQKEWRRALRVKWFGLNNNDPMFQVLLTTDAFIIRDKAYLRKFEWEYLIVDEAHRLKNPNSKLVRTLNQGFNVKRRVALTGTPLQNDLQELWALLNFLMPKIFNSAQTFNDWFNSPLTNSRKVKEDNEHMLDMTEEEKLLIIDRLHKVLRPFLIRREKAEVADEVPPKQELVLWCPLSGVQRRLADLIHASPSGPNRMVQLRKVCNHPYLFAGREVPSDESIIRTCGKFIMLDNILPKLKAANHRVLIFSQMTRLLDLLEIYLHLRSFSFLRLDGNTPGEIRQQNLQLFNEQDSPYFAFILSTKAGGLGVNLHSADTIIIFDSDWNPQNDEQAQSRAHRIGQTREVLTIRFITPDSVEETILQAAGIKLDQDALVIKSGMYHGHHYDMENERQEQVREILRRQQQQDVIKKAYDSEFINRLVARTPEDLDIFEQVDKKRKLLHIPGLITEEHMHPCLFKWALTNTRVEEQLVKDVKEAKKHWKQCYTENDQWVVKPMRKKTIKASSTDGQSYDAVHGHHVETLYPSIEEQEYRKRVINIYVSGTLTEAMKQFHEFCDLPSRNELKDYYERVKKPIALSKIRKYSDSFAFTSLHKVEKYLARLADNARLYNGIDSHIYRRALQCAGWIMSTARKNLCVAFHHYQSPEETEKLKKMLESDYEYDRKEFDDVEDEEEEEDEDAEGSIVSGKATNSSVHIPSGHDWSNSQTEHSSEYASQLRLIGKNNEAPVFKREREEVFGVYPSKPNGLSNMSSVEEHGYDGRGMYSDIKKIKRTASLSPTAVLNRHGGTTASKSSDAVFHVGGNSNAHTAVASPLEDSNDAVSADAVVKEEGSLAYPSQRSIHAHSRKKHKRKHGKMKKQHSSRGGEIHTHLHHHSKEDLCRDPSYYTRPMGDMSARNPGHNAPVDYSSSSGPGDVSVRRGHGSDAMNPFFNSKPLQSRVNSSGANSDISSLANNSNIGQDAPADASQTSTSAQPHQLAFPAERDKIDDNQNAEKSAQCYVDESALATGKSSPYRDSYTQSKPFSFRLNIGSFASSHDNKNKGPQKL